MKIRNEFMNLSKLTSGQLISINTTVGTAAEMTRFCIITDVERHIKMAIVDKHVTPILSVNDPELMAGMPRGLTELNVKQADLPTLASNALKDVCGFTNPIQASREQIVALFKAAL